jgi:hypothetical protein
VRRVIGRHRRRSAGAALIVVFAAGMLGGCGGSSTERPVGLHIALRSTRFSDVVEFAAGAGALWLAGKASVIRVNPKNGSEVARIPIVGLPLQVAADPSAVWVGVLAPDHEHGSLVRIDPTTNRVVAKIPLDAGQPMGLAVAPGTIWVDTDFNGGTVIRVDAADDEVERGNRPTVDAANNLVLGGGSLWVARPVDAAVTQIDAAAHIVRSAITVNGDTADGLLYADGAVWVGVDADNLFASATAVRVDPKTRRQTTLSIKGRNTVTSLVSAFGRIWAVSADDTIRMAQIDPATNTLVGAPTAVAGSSSSYVPDVVAAFGGIWFLTNESTLTKYVPS